MRIRTIGVVASVLCALVAGCGTAPEPTSPTSSAASSTTPSAAAPFDPSASSDVYPPTGVPRGKRVPVVVTIPGGSWQTADRSGMTPLAQRLAGAGSFVVNSTYRAGQDGVGFPVPLQDVRCAAGHALAAATEAGYLPGPVVLVGHSAGGHLVALAGVSGDALAAPCADPMPPIAAVVGLAGVYDTAEAAYLITPFFGAPRADDVALWESGDPIHYVATGAAPPSLSVLLIHGTRDTVVALAQTQSFAAALRAARIPVEVDVLPDQTHLSVIDPAVSGDRIAAFVSSLTATP